MRSRTLLLLVLAGVLGGGCVVADDDDSAVEPRPRIQIFTYPPSDPPVIAFGDVEIGADGERAFDVQNVGDAFLDITGVTTSSTASFVLVGLADLAAGIAVGGEVTILVQYVPEVEEVVEAVVSIASNDPTLPVVEISLSAEAVWSAR